MSNNLALLIGRILLAVIFILAGAGKFGDIAGTAGYITSVGLPAGTLLAWGAAIFEVVAGLAILAGFQTRIVSYLLVAFCVVSGAIFHNNFADQTQMIMFLKNLAIAGGFLALSVSGAGAWSMDSRR